MAVIDQDDEVREILSRRFGAVAIGHLEAEAL